MINWRKSSYSNTQGGECVEVGELDSGLVGLRDSKNPDAGRREMTRGAFTALLVGIKNS